MSEEEENVPKVEPKDVSIVDPEDGTVEWVSDKALQLITKSLQQGRRYFGSSAALTTHELYNPDYKDESRDVEAVKELQKATRESTDFLRQWISDKPNAVLIDSTRTPGWRKFDLNKETGTITDGYADHILLLGEEVILIETKSWGKKKNFFVDENGEVLKSKKPFPGGDTKTELMIDKWLDYLEAGASITGLIHIQGEENKVFRNRNWFIQSFRVVEHSRFEEILDEKWRLIEDPDRHNIHVPLVAQAVIKSIKPYDEYTRVINEKAVSEFKQRNS